MSVRGKRAHSNSRQPLAPPPENSRAPAGALESPVDGGAPPEADAAALIAADRDGAYWEARERQARAREAAAHWDNVARIIARRHDPAVPPAEPSGLSDREDSPRLTSAALPEVGQVEELERILNAKMQQFRLQFFGVAAEHGPSILSERAVQAPNLAEAIRTATEAEWPARAIGLRLVDCEGRELFERLRADRR
jgi:hypothetical protein